MTKRETEDLKLIKVEDLIHYYLNREDYKDVETIDYSDSNPRGRNFDEIYRVLIGLQTAETFNVALPADWQPGDDVIIPTAGSCGTAEERMQNITEMKCQDWFFCTKELPKEKVFEQIKSKDEKIVGLV